MSHLIHQINIKPGHSVSLKATGSMVYSIEQAIQNGVSDEFVALRSGHDLILKFSDGTTIQLINFFSNKAELVVSDDDKIAASEAVVIETNGDEQVVYVSASTDELGAFFKSSLSSASDSAWSLIPAIGLLSSSSNDDLSDQNDDGDTAPAEPANTTAFVSGSVIAGPVVENNDLFVLAYSAETGELLSLEPSKLQGDGSFDLEIEGFAGPAFFVLISESDTVPDYIDEALGLDINLNGALGSVADIQFGENNVTVSPLTTLAALRLGAELIGMTLDDVNLVVSNDEGISAEEVADAFVEVGQALGIDPLELAGSANAIIEIDENGQIVISDNAASNIYGVLLAALSGMDAIDGVGLTEGLQILADSIVDNQDGTTSLSNAGQSILLRGVAAASSVTTISIQQVAEIIEPEAVSQAASSQINSAADLNAMSPAVAAFVSAEQLESITDVTDIEPSILGIITPESFASLPITSYSNLSAAQLAALPSTHHTSLQQQGIALTAGVVQNLAPDAMRVISTDVISSLTTDQLQQLSASQVAGITGEQFAALPVESLAALAPAQLASVSPRVVATLSQEQFEALSPEQVQTIVINGGLNALPAEMLMTIEAATMSFVPPVVFRDLSDEDIATLTSDQLSNLTAAQLTALGVTGVRPELQDMIQSGLTQELNGSSVSSLAALQDLLDEVVFLKDAAVQAVLTLEATTDVTSEVLANLGYDLLDTELPLATEILRELQPASEEDLFAVLNAAENLFRYFSDDEPVTISDMRTLGITAPLPRYYTEIADILSEEYAAGNIESFADVITLADEYVTETLAVNNILNAGSASEITTEALETLGLTDAQSNGTFAAYFLNALAPTDAADVVAIVEALNAVVAVIEGQGSLTADQLATLGLAAATSAQIAAIETYLSANSESMTAEYAAGNIESFADVITLADEYVTETLAVNDILNAGSASEITTEALETLGLTDAQSNGTTAAYFLDALAPTDAADVVAIVEALNAVVAVIEGQGSLTADQLATLGLAAATSAQIAAIETYLSANSESMTAEAFAAVLADPSSLDTASDGGTTGEDTSGGDTSGGDTSGDNTSTVSYGPYTTKAEYIEALEAFYTGVSNSVMMGATMPFNYGEMIASLSDTNSITMFTNDYLDLPELYQSILDSALWGDMGPTPLEELLPIDEAFVLEKIADIETATQFGLEVIANYIETGMEYYDTPDPAPSNLPPYADFFIRSFAPSDVNVYQGYMPGVGADYDTPIQNTTFATEGQPTLEELQSLIADISQTFVDEQLAALQEDVDGNADGELVNLSNTGLLLGFDFSMNPPLDAFEPGATRASLMNSLSGTVTIESLEAAVDAFHDENHATIIDQIASGDPSQFDLDLARPYYWISDYTGPVIEALYDPSNYADPSAPTSGEIQQITVTVSREIQNTVMGLFDYANGMDAPTPEALAPIFGQTFIDTHYQDLLDAIDASSSVISRYYGNTSYISMLVDALNTGTLVTPYDPWGVGGGGGGGGYNPVDGLLDRIAEDMAGNSDGSEVMFYDLTSYFDNMYDVHQFDSQTLTMDAITNPDNYSDSAAPTEAEVQAVIDSVGEDLRELAVGEFRSWLVGDSTDNGVIHTFATLFADDLNGEYNLTYLMILESQKESLFSDPANVTAFDLANFFRQMTPSLDNVVAEVIEDYNGNSNGSLITLEAIQAVLPHVTADRLSLFHDEFANPETWSDPAGPLENSTFEILNRLRIVDIRIKFLDELAEDLAGNANESLAPNDFSNVLGWVPGDVYNHSSYVHRQAYDSEMLVSSNYADPTHLTWDEIIAVLEKVNEQQDFLVNFSETLQGVSSDPVTVDSLRARFVNMIEGQDAIYENILQSTFTLGEYNSSGTLNNSLSVTWQSYNLNDDEIQNKINQASGYFAVQQLFLAARDGDPITLDTIRLAGLRNYPRELLGLPAEYETEYLAALTDESNYSFGYVSLQQLNGLVVSVNRDLAVAQFVEDLAGDADGTAFNLGWLISTELVLSQNHQSFIMSKEDALNYTEVFNTALLGGTYADPANPTDAEISAVIRTAALEARELQALADLALDIEGSQSSAQLDQRETMALIGLIDDNLYDVYYRELTDPSNYADPANPTKAEAEAVAQAVTAAADASFAQIGLVASGQADRTALTLDMLNAINAEIDPAYYDYYLNQLFDKNNFLWEYQPTTQEITNAIYIVNDIVAPTTEAGMVNLATDLSNGATASDASLTERQLAAITLEIIPANTINPYYVIDTRFLPLYLDAVLDPSNYVDPTVPSASEVMQIVQDITRTEGLALIGETYANTGSYVDVNTDRSDFNVYFGILGYDAQIYRAFYSGNWVREYESMRAIIEDPASYADPTNPTWEEFQAAADQGRQAYWNLRVATLGDSFRSDTPRTENFTDLQILEAIEKAGYSVADEDWEAVEWLLRNGGATFAEASAEAAITLPERLRALANGVDDDGQGLTLLDYQNLSSFDMMLNREVFNFTRYNSLFSEIDTQAEVDLMNDILDIQTYEEATALDTSAEFYNGSNLNSDYTYTASYAGIRDNIEIIDTIMEYASRDLLTNGSYNNQYLRSSELVGLDIFPDIYDPELNQFDGYKIGELILDSANDGSEVNTLEGLERVLSRQTYMVLTSDNVPDMTLYPEGTDESRVNTAAFDDIVSFTVRFAEDVTDFDQADIEFYENNQITTNYDFVAVDAQTYTITYNQSVALGDPEGSLYVKVLEDAVTFDNGLTNFEQGAGQSIDPTAPFSATATHNSWGRAFYQYAPGAGMIMQNETGSVQTSMEIDFSRNELVSAANGTEYIRIDMSDFGKYVDQSVIIENVATSTQISADLFTEAGVTNDLHIEVPSDLAVGQYRVIVPDAVFENVVGLTNSEVDNTDLYAFNINA